MKSSQPVTVTALGLPGSPPMHGLTLDMSGSGLMLSLPRPLPCGSAVKVEAPNMLLLGEVCRCEPSDEGETQTYTIGLMISHSLTSLRELEQLNRALLGESGRVENRREAPVKVR